MTRPELTACDKSFLKDVLTQGFIAEDDDTHFMGYIEAGEYPISFNRCVRNGIVKYDADYNYNRCVLKDGELYFPVEYLIYCGDVYTIAELRELCGIRY